jgi:three-Cys-motif partner protein
MTDEELYAGREQTLIKHYILEKYLEKFALIVGSWADAITYIDGFSGPWLSRSKRLEDTSFSIALEQLRKARHTHEQHGRSFRIRCFFVEKNPTAYEELRTFATSVTDAEIETRNGEFEDSIDEIAAFARADAAACFPFVFIDPTGWTGFALERIRPLLRLTPGEVLINFMTQHIRRFIDTPQDETHESFAQLFGSADYRERVAGLAQQEREDECIRAYCEALKREGGYQYVCPAIVLHPQINRTHFHLLYATRHVKGVEVFKDAEKKAMQRMEDDRAKAQQRQRKQTTGQGELFTGEVMHNPKHYDLLRERYLQAAESRLMAMMQAGRHVHFDKLWTEAMQFPLVWPSDVQDWITHLKKVGNLRVEGLRPKEKTLKLDAGHRLVWLR